MAKQIVYSKPTLCLGCHIVGRMTRGEEAWICPNCRKDYPFIWWKIKPAHEPKTKAKSKEVAA